MHIGHSRPAMLTSTVILEMHFLNQLLSFQNFSTVALWAQTKSSWVNNEIYDNMEKNLPRLTNATDETITADF